MLIFFKFSLVHKQFYCHWEEAVEMQIVFQQNFNSF